MTQENNSIQNDFKINRTIFERLNASKDINGAVAYALYKEAKREWLLEHHNRHGRLPSKEEMNAYTMAQTDTTLNSHRVNASEILNSYAATITNRVRPQVLAEALKGSFFRSFWPSFWASFAFTAVLLAVVVIAALLGFGFPVQISLPLKPGA